MFFRGGLVFVSTFVALAASLPNPFLAQRDALPIGFTTSTSFTQSVITHYFLLLRPADMPPFRYPGCNTVACGSVGGGFRNAAVSENIFQLSACGTCWALTPNADMNGQPVPGAQSITVRVNNECPIANNERCSQQGLQGTNSLGIFLPIVLLSQCD